MSKERWIALAACAVVAFVGGSLLDVIAVASAAGIAATGRKK